MYEWYITPEEYEEAEKNGISRDTLEYRVRYLAWNKEDAVNKPLRNERYKEFNKYKEMAIKNGIPVATFYHRIYKQKISYKEAATKKPKRYPEWVKYKLKENGIKFNTFCKRIENGWDLKRACTEKTHSKEEATKKGRETQKELCLGPYRYMK